MKRIIVAVLLLSVLALAGCGGDRGPDTGGGVTPIVTPTLLECSPVDNATNVSVSTSVACAYDSLMDISSATSATFWCADGSTVVPMSYSLDATGTVVTATPNSSLSFDTQYACSVSGLFGANGLPSTSSHTWSFTTEAAPVPGNRAPRITGQSSNMTVVPGGGASFSLYGEDIDGDSLSYSCAISSGPAVTINVTSTGATGATVSWTTTTGVNDLYQVSCQATDGTTTSNVVLLEVVATSSPGPLSNFDLSPSLYVQSGSTASATLYNGVMDVTSLGSERWFIQGFYWIGNVSAGGLYEATISCTGGGVYDIISQHGGTPYTHYDEHNVAVACDGTRVLYFYSPYDDTNARLSFMPESIGTFTLGSVSMRQVLQY